MLTKYNIPTPKKLFLIMALFVICTGFAQTISVNGSNWNVNPPAITEAGTNYAGTYESASNQVTINIGGANVLDLLGLVVIGTNPWKVDIRYQAIEWNSAFTIERIRTGDGSQSGGLCLLCVYSINLGTTYEPIEEINTLFFEGRGNRINIPIQFRISGVSVTVPVANYGATIIFTVAPN